MYTSVHIRTLCVIGKMKQKTANIISILLIVCSVGYLIPKSILMTGWLESGVISGYFYLLFPVNLILIVISGLSLLTFKKNLKKDSLNSLLVTSVIGLIVMPFWIYMIYGS